MPRAKSVATSKRARPKTPAASDRVRAEWLRRVEAEYRSAAIAHHLTLWLMQIGASPDLIRMGIRIALDEMTHASLSHRAYLAAKGEGAPQIVRDSLQLVRHPSDPLELDVARVCVDVFCLGETIAVPLFKNLRERCTVPVARRVLDRVLVDEVRHRDFGWTLLGALLDLPIAPAVRALVTRELPMYFARIRQAYGPANDLQKNAQKNLRQSEVDDADRAWGLMPASQYAQVLARAVSRDWVPRFARLGFDAQAAWDA